MSLEGQGLPVRSCCVLRMDGAPNDSGADGGGFGGAAAASLRSMVSSFCTLARPWTFCGQGIQ